MMPTDLFSEELLRKIQIAIQDNIYLYALLVVLLYVVGGVDELLAIFAILNLISICLAVCETLRCANLNHLNKALLHLMHNFIMIVLCVAIDKTLNLDSAKILSLRNYILIHLAHKEVVSIYLIIKSQGANVPFLLRQYAEALKKKNSGDDEDE